MMTLLAFRSKRCAHQSSTQSRVHSTRSYRGTITEEWNLATYGVVVATLLWTSAHIVVERPCEHITMSRTIFNRVIHWWPLLLMLAHSVAYLQAIVKRHHIRGTMLLPGVPAMPHLL